MAVAVRTEQVTATDGSFAAHVALPERGEGPGILLLQEVFGVNRYIRSVAERLAGLGYVALAPDLFWRIERGVAIDDHSDAALRRAMGYAAKFDPERGVADLGAALAAVRALPECTGPVGVLGFCFGGTMAYLTAVHHDPAAVVSYYGSGVAGAIGEVGRVCCPLQLHFGDEDPYLPMADVDRIVAATDAMDSVEIVVQHGAGHAFDNSFSPTFSNPMAARAAWEETRAPRRRGSPPPARRWRGRVPPAPGSCSSGASRCDRTRCRARRGSHR
jgi:carboxymethylenebutenolidase